MQEAGPVVFHRAGFLLYADGSVVEGRALAFKFDP
jgi:hypothetical protein